MSLVTYNPRRGVNLLRSRNFVIMRYMKYQIKEILCLKQRGANQSEKPLKLFQKNNLKIENLIPITKITKYEQYPKNLQKISKITTKYPKNRVEFSNGNIMGEYSHDPNDEPPDRPPLLQPPPKPFGVDCKNSSMYRRPIST